jgi:hypothetical protein
MTIAALEPAVNAGHVNVVDGEVRFRHPLIRSAVRQAGDPHMSRKRTPRWRKP